MDGAQGCVLTRRGILERGRWQGVEGVGAWRVVEVLEALGRTSIFCLPVISVAPLIHVFLVPSMCVCEEQMRETPATFSLQGPMFLPEVLSVPLIFPSPLSLEPSSYGTGGPVVAALNLERVLPGGVAAQKGLTEWRGQPQHGASAWRPRRACPVGCRAASQRCSSKTLLPPLPSMRLLLPHFRLRAAEPRRAFDI